MNGQTGDDCYDDIIDLPHPVSSRHPQMPRGDRAAQFASFAALSGHKEAVREAGRLTDARVTLDENQWAELDEKMSRIQAHLAERPEVSVTYFQPDLKKEGGAYVTKDGVIKKIDMYERHILMEDGTRIPLAEVVSVLCDITDECRGI